MLERITSVSIKLCLIVAVGSVLIAAGTRDPPKVQPFNFPPLSTPGETVVWACGVSKGAKPLQFRWSKDGRSLLDIPNTDVLDKDMFSVLTVGPASRENVGNYTCTVSNSYGEDSHTAGFKLNVPSTWTKVPEDQKLAEGDRLELSCRAEGHPKPTLWWTYQIGQNHAKNISTSDTRRHVSANGSLVIVSVKGEDAGRYICHANNGFDQPITSQAVVTVHVPARFEEKFKLQSIRQGDSAVLRCDVTGDQPITIVWMKDKNELEITELSRYEKFETSSKNGVNSELFIRNVDRRDGALYACVATNAYGNDERSIKVLVVEVPAQPLDVKATEVWPRSVAIRWSAPYAGNSAITKYKIQYWRDKHGPQTLHEAEVAATQTNAVVQNLKPGSTYALAVVAENEIGHGEPSETIRFTTREEEPSGPPTDLYVEARGPTSILVRWKPPPKECWNGILKGYYVGYRAEGGGIQQQHLFKSIEANPANLSNEYLITGLTKSARYSVLVKAYNKAGTGPPSQELVIRTLDGDLPKSPPISLVSTSDNAITVQWNQVLPRDEPMMGSGYTLHYQKGTGQWLHVPLVSPDQASYSLTGLQADTLYHVYLTANNRHGRGQASEVLAVKTKLQGSRDIPMYMDLSLMIPAAAALVAVIVVIVVIVVYVTKSRSREDLVKDQIKALHDQQHYIYAAAGGPRYGDKPRPYSQGETPGTPAASFGSYASIPSRVDQDEFYGVPPEVKGPYGQTYKERPSSFPRPNSKRSRDHSKNQQQQQQPQQPQGQPSAQPQQQTQPQPPQQPQQAQPPPPPPPPPPPGQ